MAIDIQVPRLAESISEAVLVEWLKEDGAAVRVDEPIATLETDKAAVEIAASETLCEIMRMLMPCSLSVWNRRAAVPTRPIMAAPVTVINPVSRSR